MLEMIMASVSAMLLILVLRDFMDLIPYLADSISRARGSRALEASVRVSHNRNMVALAMVPPAMLIVYRYHLWEPAYIQALAQEWRLAAVAGAFLAYLLLRDLMYQWLKPQRGADTFKMAYHYSYTFFILFMLVVLLTVAVLELLQVPMERCRMVLWVEIAVLYFVHVIRKAQILSLSYPLLKIFLYLCGLEFFPTALLIISGLV